MKYRLLSAVIMLCVSHNAFAEMREFKSQKGAVFKAEPLVVRGPNLVLKGENGREVTVAIKSLMKAVGLPSGILRKPLKNLEGDALLKGLRIVKELELDKKYGWSSPELKAV